MAYPDYVLNGAELDPNGFNVVRIKKQRAGEMANGDLVFDVIAVKRRFELTFEAITGTEKAALAALHASGQPVTFAYPEGGSQQEKMVVVDDLQAPIIALVPQEEWGPATLILLEV